MVKIKISELLQRLKNGETREELREALQMNSEDYKAFISHPKIKGVKTGIGRTIEFEDDVEVDLGDNPGGKNVWLNKHVDDVHTVNETHHDMSVSLI